MATELKIVRDDRGDAKLSLRLYRPLFLTLPVGKTSFKRQWALLQPRTGRHALAIANTQFRAQEWHLQEPQ